MTDTLNAQTLIEGGDADTSTTSISSSQLLRYPQLLLDASFDSLLTHSFPSAPQTNMEPVPRAPPSLSESWASISDAEYSHDDDLQSEHTDVGSLNDIHSIDDVQSIRDDTISEDEAGEAESDLEQPPSRDQPDLHSSSLSRTPAASYLITKDESTSEEITFIEPAVTAQHEPVVVKHTLRVLRDSEVSKLGLPAPAREGFFGTVHMTLSKSSMTGTSRNSFRLLLLGPDYTDSLRNNIVNKIADALVASNIIRTTKPPSRYHIIPDSFGPGSQPAAAEVIPIDNVLDVEHFHSGIIGGLNQRNIILCNEHNIQRTLSTYDEQLKTYGVTTPGWQQPDLAVILIDSEDSEDDRLSACSMMIFARRHNIPIIFVRMDNGWDADFAPLVFADTGAHLSIEQRPLSEDSVLRNLPLDLTTFLNLNPAQLGRHIAYLIQNSDDDDAERVGQQSVCPEAPQFDEVEPHSKGILELLSGHARRMGFKNLVHMFTVMLCSLILAHCLVSFQADRNLDAPDAATTRVLTPNPIISIQSGTVSLSVAFPSSTPHSPTVIESTAPTTAAFEAEPLGTSHIVVKLPKNVSHKGIFSFTVHRGPAIIDTDVRMLFPSVYSMRLDPNLAHGELSVCLQIAQKSSKECVSVDFGRQSFAGWVKELIDDSEGRLQQKLAVLHESLEDIRKSERPRDVVKDAQKRLTDLRHNAEQDLNSRWAAALAWQAQVSHQLGLQRMTVQGLMAEAIEEGRARGQYILQEVSKSIDSMRDAVEGTDMSKSAAQFWRGVRGTTRSETLATSQERAQYIVRKLRGRIGGR